MEDIVIHSGVKGMRWGVRRDRDKGHSTFRNKLNSLKRERQWNSVLREMDSLSTKDITAVTKRVSLENALKTLSRSKVGTKKDKEDYLRREHMDNEELSRKVIRLKAKESLHNAVRSASKEQREFGQRVTQIGGSLGVRYAFNRRLTTDDYLEVLSKPKESYDKAGQDVLKVVMDKMKSKK